MLRSRRLPLLAALGASALLAGCTLGEPFRPGEVLAPNLPVDGGEPAPPRDSPPVVDVPDDTDAGVVDAACENREILGCDLVVTPRPDEPEPPPARPDGGAVPDAAAAVPCGGACAAGSFCADSGVCEPVPPRCDDGLVNGSEPVVDCGNVECGPCALGHECTADAQCETGFCAEGTCQVPPCADGAQNGLETDTDCGGADVECARCALGLRCAIDADCVSGATCTGGRCSACGDGAQNGTETGLDCGGVCGPCEPGQGCGADADCDSAVCQDQRCCGGGLADCTRCAERLAGFINCNTNGPNGAAECAAFLQCLGDNPTACPTRHTPGCSDAGGVCDHTRFGSNSGPGIILADNILGTAECSF